MSEPAQTAEYRLREPYREALREYLIEAAESPNFMRIMADLSPAFGVDPDGYRTPGHRRLRVMLGLAGI